MQNRAEKSIIVLIVTGYAMVILLVTSLGLFAIAGMNTLNSISHDLFEHPFTVNDASLEATETIAMIRDKMLLIALTDDPKQIEKLASDIPPLDKEARGHLDTVKASFLGDMRRVEEAEILLKKWPEIRSREIDLSMHGSHIEAMRLITGVGAELFNRLDDDLDYVTAFTRQKAAAFLAESERQAAIQINRTVWFLAALIMAISITGWMVARRVLFMVRRAEQMEIKLLEAEHQATSAAYARSLIEASLDPLVTISPAGKITDVNHATELVTGRSRSELIGTDFPAYFTDPEQASAGYRQVFAESSVSDYPLSILHRDGHITDVLYNASIYRNEAGEVLGVFAAARDITEHKKAEEELLERERNSQSLLRLSRVMERSQTYAEVLNAAQDEVKKILGYQSLWVYLFTEDKQYLKAFIAGGPVSDTVMSEEGTATLTIKGDRMLEEIAASKEIVLVEDARTDERVNKEIVERLGMRTIVNIPIMMFDRHLGCVGTGTFGAEGVRVPSGSEQKYLMAMASHMAVALDRVHLLNERKQAEANIRQLNNELEQRVIARTTELESANKELEAFSYSVSHDLRTPLRAIDGFSLMLLEDYAGKLDDEGNRLLKVVRNNTNRMSHLIDDILHFSRVGRLEISCVETDMEQLVRDVREELETVITRRNLQINIGALPKAYCDRTMMHQVIENLLSNAIKFSGKKDDARIDIGGRIEADKAIYYVRDNGVGFDMQYADKLFGVFQRLHGVDEFEGTGIGLAIVKRIISRHGGTVWAEGEVGRGATLYFSIPVSPKT